MRFNKRMTVLLLFPATVFLASSCFAEESQDDASSRLIVRLDEYHADMRPPNDASPAEILKQLVKQSTKPIRTIRLSTFAERPAKYREGNHVGISPPRSGDSTEVEPQFVETETRFQLTWKRNSSTILMEFDFTTSHLAEPHISDAPRVKELTIQGTYSFRLGEPCLIGGLTSKDEIYLVLTVTEPKDTKITDAHDE